MGTVLDREEYVEQAYFFRTFRERLAENLPSQEVLATLDQEILTTTRLPMAVQFLATEIKHSGLLSTGFERLTQAMSLIFGTEAFVVLKDIWGLDRKRAEDVALWTCHALIQAALKEESRDRRLAASVPARAWASPSAAGLLERCSRSPTAAPSRSPRSPGMPPPGAGRRSTGRVSRSRLPMPSRSMP